MKLLQINIIAYKACSLVEHQAIFSDGDFSEHFKRYAKDVKSGQGCGGKLTTEHHNSAVNKVFGQGHTKGELLVAPACEIVVVIAPVPKILRVMALTSLN